VIVGGAFGTITKSLTDDIIMPVVGAIFGGLDFSSYFVRLGPIPAGYAGSLTNYAALKAAGVPLLGFGQFITVAINFLILAFLIFLLVKAVSKVIASRPPAADAQLALLTEIRDELRKK
jgi:large conductance mechanosensitive channel